MRYSDGLTPRSGSLIKGEGEKLCVCVLPSICVAMEHAGLLDGEDTALILQRELVFVST